MHLVLSPLRRRVVYNADVPYRPIDHAPSGYDNVANAVAAPVAVAHALSIGFDWEPLSASNRDPILVACDGKP